MTGLLSPVALFLPGTTHDYAIWQAGPSILSKDVAFGPDGNLYVTAQGSNDVVRFRAPSDGNNAAEIFVPAGSGGVLYLSFPQNPPSSPCGRSRCSFKPPET